MDGPNAADWLSAGSAAVQAIGAVVAIGYTVKLARDSVRREQAAAAAAELRAKAADEAAERRALEADQAAERRLKAAEDATRHHRVIEENSRHNAAIDIALGLGEDALQEWEAWQTRCAGMAPETMTTIETPRAQLLADNRATMIERANSPETIAAINDLVETLCPFPRTYFGKGPALVPIIADKVHRAGWPLVRLRQLRKS